MGVTRDVVQATVRHAIAAGYLGREQLREALLLQEQLRAAGREVTILGLLGARYLAREHVVELERVYREQLARAQAAAASPSDVEEEAPTPATLEVPPDALARSTEMAARPPELDPEPVQRFLRESAPAMPTAPPSGGVEVDDKVFVSLAKKAGYPSKEALRACREQQLERRRRGQARTLFELACECGLLDARARRRFERWAEQIAARAAEPLEEDEPEAPPGAPAPRRRVLHESAATFQVVTVPPCAACGAELDPLTAMEGQGRCPECVAAAPKRERVALAAPPSLPTAPPPPPPPVASAPPPSAVAPASKPVEASRKGRRQKLAKALKRSAEFVARGLLRAPKEGAPPRAPRQVVHLVAATAGGAVVTLLLTLAVVAATSRPGPPPDAPPAPGTEVVVTPPQDSTADADWAALRKVTGEEAPDALRAFARAHHDDPRAPDAMAFASLMDAVIRRAEAELERAADAGQVVDTLVAEARRETDPFVADALLAAVLRLDAGHIAAKQARAAVRERAELGALRAAASVRDLARSDPEGALRKAALEAGRWDLLGQSAPLLALLDELVAARGRSSTPATPTKPTPAPVAITPWTPDDPAPSTPTTPSPTTPGPTTSTPPAPTTPGPDVRRLFVEATTAFAKRERAGVASGLEALQRAAPDAAETRAVRGFERALAGQHAVAAEALAGALELDEPWVTRATIESGFFGARYAECRAAVAREGDAEEKALWTLLLDGPFRAATPLAADVCEVMSPDGRYRVITDIGLDLPKLERALRDLPPERRAEAVAKLRRQHVALKQVADLMDKAARAYTNLLSAEPGELVVPTVYVFRDEAAFAAFSRSLGVGSTENTLGYYMPGLRILAFYEGGGRRDGLSKGTIETLLHEAFHQWLHLYVERAPHWFNEGMAEFFGRSEVTAEGLRYGLLPQDMAWYRTFLLGHDDTVRVLPLRDLLVADRDRFMAPAQASVNYAHAWSFVHFLASTPDGRKGLRDYFHAIRGGKGLEEAFDAVFGRANLEQVEQRWREYVGALR